MSDSFDAMRKAQEDRFFKLEQERHIMAYIKKLKASGRFDSIPAPSTSRGVSSTALPQVMAHSVRLSQPVAETRVSRQLDRSFLTRHVVKGVCTGDPYLISSATLGSRVSLGKNKWSAGTVASGVENTTIFSVHKASELMSQGPAHIGDGVESRAARHMVDNSFVEVAGRKIKLMPDPTPGRAMAWGGTLAVWGTAAIAVGTCKALGIATMEDLRRVMREQLTPLGDRIKASVTPVKTFFHPNGAPEGPRVVTADSGFSNGVKRIFA
mgnify:CR=1 FL=1|jgi:hypothetical protein